MNVEPCNVCGATDVNLVDGFYYCVECGTQDVNVRETIIEERALADGTFTIKRHNKVTLATEETQELSGEWHKWHTFNFVLSGLADELIAAGAKPTFKKKLLWLWTKYIKRFQNKDELDLTKDGEEDDDKENSDPSDDEASDDSKMSKKKKKNTDYRTHKLTTDLSIMKKGLLCSLLYVALNLDNSDIQLFDIIRFIREGRLDFQNCLKYVPQEVKFRLVPQWESFSRSRIPAACINITAMSIYKCFKILPILPDLRLLVDRYTKELCLPKDFKNLVFSLMNLVPCDVFLDIDRSIVNCLLRSPAYEQTIMGYILVAFKMCFGLDDRYEVMISETVDRVNDVNCHLKSYKLGEFSEPTDRLFSFREWCSFIQLRKILLCKHYLHVAEQYALDIDDYVYMEQCQSRNKEREPQLSDEITMNLLDKIPLVNTAEVIPKSEIKATLTPLSTYTDLLLQYISDPDLRLLFSEDFTQYSLKYAVEKLSLTNEDDLKNIVLGVDETNKIISDHILGRLGGGVTHDVSMVYVRNCENKNWLKTKQPTAEHIKKVTKSNSDKDSDHGYDSNAENTSEVEISSKDEESSNPEEENAEDKTEVPKLEIIEEEDYDKNIFDDDFINVDLDDDKILIEDEIKSEPREYNEDANIDQNTFLDDEYPDDKDNISQDVSDIFFNPDTFDRERTIKELILGACKKYKIRIPHEYRTTEPKKRKSKLVNDEAGESGAKRRRIEDGTRKRRNAKSREVREQVHKLLADYYNNLQNDVMFQISEHVKNVVNNVSQVQDDTHENNITNGDEQQTDFLDGDIHADAAVENDDETDNINPEQDSLQVIENENDEDNNQAKTDPRFDENQYDIKQLYVKVDGEEDSDTDGLFGIDKDPELIAILDKKIEEADKGEIPSEPENEEKTYDSDDDDVPLSVVQEEIEALRRQKERHTNLQKLIPNQEHITEFKYWTRFYATLKLGKEYDLNEPFNMELEENFPTSFLFVIKECAGVVGCTPYQLYKSMIALEQCIMSHNR